MKKGQGSIGVALVECTNERLRRYIVRWNIEEFRPGDGIGEKSVMFTQADFMHKPTAEEVERAIAYSGVDATEAELEEIGRLLGYGKDDFEKKFSAGRAERIATDPQAQLMELVREQHLAATSISDKQALQVPTTFFTFSHLCKRSEPVEKGVVFRYNNKMWRVVQTHTPQTIFPPSMDTASLYARIFPQYEGTIENPVIYEQGMVFIQGKYYEQYGVTYVCILSTSTGYPNDLEDLPTIVQVVSN